MGGAIITKEDLKGMMVKLEKLRAEELREKQSYKEKIIEFDQFILNTEKKNSETLKYIQEAQL